MINYVSPLVFGTLFVVGAGLAAAVARINLPAAIVLIAAWTLGDVVVAAAIHVAAEWERAVVFRLGKFLAVKGPGLFLIVPILDQLRRIDTRCSST